MTGFFVEKEKVRYRSSDWNPVLKIRIEINAIKRRGRICLIRRWIITYPQHNSNPPITEINADLERVKRIDEKLRNK
jgi:hypothetical protein